MDSDNTSNGRFEMGTREAIKREVKEEPVDGENYQPEQEQQQDEDEPTSDAKDQITIHDYFFSGGKQMLPSAIPNGPRRSRSKHQNFEIVKEHSEVRSSVMDKAEEIQANLDPQYPSFVKIMLHSHVTRGFWLGLPVAFCKMHMPKHNGICILVDEDGEEFKTRFLAAKMGISGGWTSFATAHKLLEGDAVVFHLIKTHKFEVHIVRGTTNGRESGEVRKEMDTRATSFVDFENFNIVVNNEVLDIQMSTSIKRKYYELCRAQKSYLHAGFLKTIKSSSAAEIISDIVKIADAIRSSNISTPTSHFANWEKTLAAFDLLGIEVGFLRARVSKLAYLAAQFGERRCAKFYKKAKLDQDLAEEEIRILEAKLEEAQQRKARYNVDILLLNKYVQKDELTFREEANSPW